MVRDHRRIKSHWIQPFPVTFRNLISEFSSFKSFDKETVTEIFLDFPPPLIEDIYIIPDQLPWICFQLGQLLVHTAF